MGRFLDIALPYADDQMSMDVEHALMIGQFIREAGINTVVEVGCCYGVSTGAILDAFDASRIEGGKFAFRKPRHLHLIDPSLTSPVMDMSDLLNETGVENLSMDFTGLRSLDTSKAGFPVLGLWAGELVVLDGDHSVEAVVGEVRTLMEWPEKPDVVVFHDSGRDGLDGPKAGVDFLLGNGYCPVTNDDPGLGKRTGRGLTFCTHYRAPGYGRIAHRVLLGGGR